MENAWDRRLGLGNPAADKTLKNYLRLLTAEQLQARVIPKQAIPFLLEKLTNLAQHLDRALDSSDITPTQRFLLARDQAYFKAVFFSGAGADLEENLTGVHQLGSPVCIVGAPFLGGSGGMPPREIFEN